MGVHAIAIITIAVISILVFYLNNGDKWENTITIHRMNK